MKKFLRNIRSASYVPRNVGQSIIAGAIAIGIAVILTALLGEGLLLQFLAGLCVVVTAFLALVGVSWAVGVLLRRAVALARIALRYY